MSEGGNALISVIVPVYNTEKWLRTCVESICMQSYPFLEILLIDDGSTDDSLKVCRELEQLDSRIHVLTKKNSGVSDTRNLGIRNATGKYITFVDSDDYLQKEILEKAVCCMAENHMQLCVWNMSRVEGGIVREEPDIQTGVIHRKEAVTAIIYDSCSDVPLGRYFRASCGKLYCTDIMKNNHIFFPIQQKIGEDALFLLDYLSHVEHIFGVNQAGYFYRITNTSAVRRYRTDLPEQNQMQLDAITEYLKRYPEFYAVRTRTAQTCLAWDMFRRLIRNGLAGEKADRKILERAKSEAKTWYENNEDILRQTDLDVDRMPKTTRIQYYMAGRLPLKLLLTVSTLLERRKV